MRNPSLKACVVALASLLTASACAQPPCAPRVTDGWIRVTPGGMAMMAGYARIENACPSTASIVGASSPAFADTSIHETTLQGGMSRMRPVPRLQVPAHGDVALRPGGAHLMLMQPRTVLKAGDTVEIDFALEDGRTLRGRFTLRAATP
jgi:copper(I)-binding protein